MQIIILMIYNFAVKPLVDRKLKLAIKYMVLEVIKIGEHSCDFVTEIHWLIQTRHYT